MRLPGFHLAHLALHLGLDGVAHRCDRVDILDLGLRVEVVGALGSDRDVGVAAQVGFLHIGFRDADPAQDLAQADHVLGGLVRRAQVGRGDHLDQRDAAAVEIDQSAVVLVLGLAGVLFEVQLRDGDPADVGLPASLHRHVQVTAARQRHIVLGDLVALGQVGVEIVLAVEERDRLDIGVHGSRQQDAFLDHGFVQHRQHARHTAAYRTDVGVWLVIPRIRLAGAEDLGGGVELDMGFESDDGFVFGHEYLLASSFHAQT